MFEYYPEWAARGVELAPLTMPVRRRRHVFPQLPEATFHRLPALLADALPDDFGNAVIDAWLARQGVGRGAATPLDRLAYMADRAMGALEFRPSRGPRHRTASAVELSDLDEVQRWLRGEARPAVQGRRSPGTALTRGLRTLVSRMLGGEVRRLEAKTPTMQF